ncbi:MAG: SDR family oxidoreductase [Candidatus Obscuribacterales bacterium]|nr:SDR family oxidoreductase [Candidatus Obscuribacterales bacterium]
MPDLTNKVIVVTGGATGIGKHYASHLVGLGASVAVLDNRLPQSCKEEDHLLKLRCDIANWSQVETAINQVHSKFSRIDVLVNNASTHLQSKRSSFADITPEQWNRTFAVNVQGTFHCIKACFPFFEKQNEGKIINLSSDAPLKGLPNLLDYVASKGSIISMTRALARELGSHNITVNAVAPGLVKHEDFPNWSEDRDATVKAGRCLQRTQTPSDLCGVIAFLCSAESSFITGQTIVVDGGEVFI